GQYPGLPGNEGCLSKSHTRNNEGATRHIAEPRRIATAEIFIQRQFDKPATRDGFSRRKSHHRKTLTALRNKASPSPSWASPSRVQRGCCVGRTWRSGCGIKPSTRPVASHNPATAPCEPLGLRG